MGPAAELCGEIAHPLTTRTVSPYFSPNRAMAPVFFASSRLISSVTTESPAWISLFTISSTRLISSGVMAEKWVKSKRRRSLVTKEPACSTWSPRTVRSALWSKWVALWFLAGEGAVFFIHL